jgi:phage tail sheath gpL-like
MTSALIPITGVDSGYRVPGVFAEILFAQGPTSAIQGAREICLVMPKLSTGAWTAATLYRVTSEKDVIDGAGSGSPLHVAARIALQANKNAKLWALPVAETASGSPVAGTWTCALTGPATATGTLEIDICGETASFTYASGTAATDIGTGMVAAINAKTWLPVVASGTSTVTLTAKLKGISQGPATVPAIRCRSRVTIGSGVGTTDSGGFVGTGVAGADGSTTEAANTATALAAIAGTKKYYLVSSAMDATTLGHFKTHLATKAEPRQGMRSQAVAAYCGSLATCQTLATAKNYERLTICHQINSEWPPAAIAANGAAVMQKRQQTDSAYNFAGYSEPDWLVPPSYSSADYPDGDDMNDAICDGITEIASKNGGSYIVMLCNTRSKDSTGALDDFRVTEGHRVSVADEFVDDQIAQASLNHKGKKLRDDERLADGTVNQNQKRYRGVLTPSQLYPEFYKQIDTYYDAGKIQDTDGSKASFIAVKSPTNASRVEAGYSLHVIDHCHQITFRVSEVSTG